MESTCWPRSSTVWPGGPSVPPCSGSSSHHGPLQHTWDPQAQLYLKKKGRSMFGYFNQVRKNVNLKRKLSYYRIYKEIVEVKFLHVDEFWEFNCPPFKVKTQICLCQCLFVRLLVLLTKYIINHWKHLLKFSENNHWVYIELINLWSYSNPRWLPYLIDNSKHKNDCIFVILQILS